MFNNWETTYNADNKKMEENKGTYEKTEIPEWFKNKYHNYHRANYGGENIKSIGVYGDKPTDKFLDKTQVSGKLYNDNYDIALGTTKTTNHIPGYTGIYIIIYLL
jgi:hypothetical protein